MGRAGMLESGRAERWLGVKRDEVRVAGWPAAGTGYCSCSWRGSVESVAVVQVLWRLLLRARMLSSSRVRVWSGRFILRPSRVRYVGLGEISLSWLRVRLRM